MKTFFLTGILAASLALTANVASAATPANPIPQRSSQLHAPAPTLAPHAGLNADIAQFISGMLGVGPIPYASLVRDARGAAAASGSYDWSSSPSYDYSTAPAVSATNDAQMAADEENQAIEEMNDINAQTASMAAAEEENDEANAATLQTEINAGM